MARKNTHSHKMLDAVTLAADRTSAATNVMNMDKASIYFEWSGGGTPVGVLTVQARNSKNGTWFTLDMGSTMSVSGNSGEIQVRLDELPFYEIRVVYTRTSGTATSATATIVVKQVGG